MTMASFSASMTIEGDDSGPVPVKALIEDGTISIHAAGESLGSWPVDSVKAVRQDAGVGLALGEDHVVLDLVNSDEFLIAIGDSATQTTGGKGRRERKKNDATAKDRTRRRRRLGLRGWVALVLVVGVVGASAVVPVVVGSTLLLIGLAVLLLGAGAMVETRVALRLPTGLEGIHLVVVGVVVILVGMGLTLAG